MTLVKPGFEVSFSSIGTAKEERKETLVRSLTDESLSSPIAALDVSTKRFLHLIVSIAKRHPGTVNALKALS